MGYSLVYHERVLHNYFTQCHRKYSGQHNHCDIALSMMGRLDVKQANKQLLSCILMGCIFFGMVKVGYNRLTFLKGALGIVLCSSIASFGIIAICEVIDLKGTLTS